MVHLNNVLRYINTQQLSIKNKKLFHLKKKILPINVISCTRVPVINLSDYDFDMEGLKYGLHHFVDKSKSVKRNIAVELENIAHLVQKDVSSKNMEYFHEYLRKMTNKFTQNIYHTKDDTYRNLCHSIQKNDIVLLAGDKDSLVVVMNEKDYILKEDNMINEVIQQGKYEWTNDKTHEDLEKFQHFLYRNFKNHSKYSDMRLVSNEPARFFATTKTHKFDDHSLINLDDLKFRPVIDQSNTYSYNAAKIVSDYLQPLRTTTMLLRIHLHLLK